jgi:two-component sensor histidine kinase
VADDGIGLPRDIDLSSLKTLGLQLVNMLARQINGKVEIKQTRGTEISVTFAGD